MKELAIIIPMYNEEQNAARCVRAVCEILLAHLPGTILLVVNDGSKDRTAEVLRGLESEKLPFVFVSHPTNYGYGAALLTGVQEALKRGFEYGLFMDSDLTNDPKVIPAFAEKLSSGRYDVVKASRFVAGGGMQGVPWRRQIFSITGNRVASILFNMGLRDCTNGFHAVRLSFIAHEVFTEKGFPFLLEELYVLKKKRARVAEIPYTLTSREEGEGVSSFAYTPEVIGKYLKYALKSAFV